MSSITSADALLNGKAEHDADNDGGEAEYAIEYARSHRHRGQRYRRSPFGTFLGILTVTGLTAAILILFWSKGQNMIPVRASSPDLHPLPAVSPVDSEDAIIAVPTDEPHPKSEWKTNLSQWVNGEPTAHFQDNLRGDMQYVTTWTSGGWTNDFMTYINMIYVGLLSSRTPIIPPFAPSHVAWDGGFPPFGDIFDVPRLAAAINSPLLEWRDLKHENSTELDQLGCWTIWGLVGDSNGRPRDSLLPRHLNLDVAYTALPKSSGHFETFWIPFWTLAKLGFPERRGQALAENPPLTPAPNSGVQLPPDERLMCFDFMYYVGAQDRDEWWWPWSPAWRFVGIHAHWEVRLEGLALGYIQRMLGIPEDSDETPPFIAVHVRRGDFTAACGPVPRDECFAPLSAYARRVVEVSAALLSKGFGSVQHVIITSDETDPEWWKEVDALGWRRTDHEEERTVERYGKWYPSLIDAVVQSKAVGFVGTDRSTMSLVALRRVRDWNRGVAELVRIGSKDADAH